MLKIANADVDHRFGLIDRQHRENWMRQRRALEAGLTQPRSLKRRAKMLRERGFTSARRMFEFGLRATRLYDRGVGNAESLTRTDMVMFLDGLSREFDGYRIAHITDCHFDSNPRLLDRLQSVVAGETVDLCVFTGDYQDDRACPDCARGAAAVAEVAAAFEQRDGALAVLGNHDSTQVVAPLEARGVRVLGNEWVSVPKERERIVVTGLDDVHYFESPMAYKALAAAPEGFRIVLAHSPDAAYAASFHGHDLYLCGHTHGGQVCLPGGRPIVGNHRGDPRFSTGRWACGRMAGYTNRGAGTSMLPVRFNAPPEVAFLTLRCFRGRLE